MKTTIYTSDAVLTMNASRDVVPSGAIAVRGQTIHSVGPAQDPTAAAPEADVVDLTGHVLMPGLVNSHHHSGVLRGTADYMPVWEWLRLHIDPMHRVLRRMRLRLLPGFATPKVFSPGPPR